ncbi:hypothetical protein WN944_022121 [Citrus x changshan-huyou]|uniref:Uncharacterized protein n=1 Tax=Citrus x changshan-huyou TaxID=2935761 RepID=A0AAP0N3Y0_9ROSI
MVEGETSRIGERSTETISGDTSGGRRDLANRYSTPVIGGQKINVEKFDGKINFGIWRREVMDALIQIDLDVVLKNKRHFVIFLAKNQTYHARTKHIDVKYHYVRKIIEGSDVLLKKINTKDNPSDMLTKLQHHLENATLKEEETSSSLGKVELLANGREPDVLVIPYPAEGHPGSLMKLSMKIPEHGIKVRFVSTEQMEAKSWLRWQKKMKSLAG